MKIFSILFLTLTVAFLHSGCGEKDRDKLGDAQFCLDKATPATANSCLDKISGNESAAAYTLRCAAGFIAQGYDTPQKFISAYDQLKSNPSGCSGSCSPTLGLMSVLTFNYKSTAAENIADSEAVFSHCKKAGSQSYLLIATFVKAATLISGFAGVSGTPTPAQLEAAAIAIAGGGSATIGGVTINAGTIGDIAQTTYQASCSNTSGQSNDNQQLCTELNAALSSGSDSNSVGMCLLNKWQNPSYVCP